MEILNTPLKVKLILRVISILLILTVPLDSFARQLTSKHKYTAKFVYNIMSHVDFKHNIDGKINICIIGDNAMTPHLTRIVKNKNANSYAILHRYIDDNLNNCDVLYIDENFKEDESRALLKTKSSNALTIGNIRGFANRGGIIEFNLRKNKVELKINLSQINSNKFIINDSLLSVSDTVNNSE
ncbi:MAG: YfiR family protein [Proteobacteria bacterium]|nr:YfiR family protein [Pseudomonadota bacterium]